MTISKTLHLWITKYDSIHIRDETHAAEARQPAVPARRDGRAAKAGTRRGGPRTTAPPAQVF
jgi:hypothetical protein